MRNALSEAHNFGKKENMTYRHEIYIYIYIYILVYKYNHNITLETKHIYMLSLKSNI